MVDSRYSEFRSRLETHIAQGCLTNSKHPSCFVNGVYPVGIKAGLAAYVEGDDGRQYFDTICGLGSISLGYRNTQVDKAVISQIVNNGATFSLASAPEVEAAEYLLQEFLFQYDAVKWLKTGNEATSAAVRIARSATGRKQVIQVGYHGHGDQWISTKKDPKGLAEEFFMSELPDIQTALPFVNSTLAAIIVEPIMLDHSPENTHILKELKEACLKHGVILIFDEIVCGLRIPEGFISSLIEPDLICVGKGIANGYALSGVVGKKHLMHATPYFVSSTFAGETTALVAAKETMNFWKKNTFHDVYERANQTMNFITDLMAPFHVKLEGYGTRAYWQTESMDHLALVFQEACRAQVLLGRSFFYNFASRQFDDTLRSRLEDAAMNLKRSDCILKGMAPKDPFKRI